MNRYDGRVSNRQVATGAVVVAIAVTTMIAGSHWLLPPSGATIALEAPAEFDDTGEPAPGSVQCPTTAELDAEPTPISPSAGDLIDCPDLYDGWTVTYTGEAIEAVFPLGDRTVVTLNDDDYALQTGPLPEARTALGGNSGLAVVLPPGTTDRIRFLGDYRHRGDRLEVVGTYDSAADVLGGEPAIVADDVVTIERGYRIEHAVGARTAVAAVVAAAGALAVAITTRRKRV